MAHKTKVSEIQFNADNFRPYSDHFLVPDPCIGDAKLHITGPDLLRQWQKQFIDRWGDLVLTFDQYRGYNARFRSNFKAFRDNYIASKAQILSSWK